MIIGLTLDKALEVINDPNVNIIYNNCDKLASWDVQLVVAYRLQEGNNTIVVGNFKTEV